MNTLLTQKQLTKTINKLKIRRTRTNQHQPHKEWTTILKKSPLPSKTDLSSNVPLKTQHMCPIKNKTTQFQIRQVVLVISVLINNCG